ncbi:isopeptide-forming domain-containing fimbrial protein [Streptomyces sp. NPDC051684]|uniref:isopeptide-forming domain-containing fimbrial protein n=1 Tax=Streptomyces sp. NPDC051684 TaxID=3365670 RepID=UPI0037B93C4F
MLLKHLQGKAACAVTAALAACMAGLAPSPASADVVSPFAKRYDESIYGDFKTIGNTVMGCPTDDATMAARCAVAANGEGKDNNNTFNMQRINTAGTTDGYGSSTGRVTVPPGAEVAYARLFYGGNDGTYKGPSGAQMKRCDISGADVDPSPGDPLDAAPAVGVNGAAPTKVSPENLVKDPASTRGPHYYTGEADVTSLFSGVTGTGTPVPVSVGDIWAPTGKGCVAGWSMTVVYKYDSPNETYAPDRRNVYIYGGHVLQRSTSPATRVTVDGFYRTSGTPHASVTAYEGDWNTPGDKFAVGGQNIPEAHTGNTNNFFISEDDGALDPKMVNNLSIDAKEFDVTGSRSTRAAGAEPIPVGSTSTTLDFSTKGDTYVPSALALSVPVPDLEISKTASPAKVEPGDTVTYTVKAKNVSRLPYPNAKFTDDLTENLDDATYNGDAKASIGDVDYTRPKINFTGDIPAGQTATVTYSVKVNDPVSGDGKLTNSVTADTPRTNCEEGSTDERCGIAPVIEREAPAPSPTSPEPTPTPTKQPGEQTTEPTPAPSASSHSPQARPTPPNPPSSGEMAETGTDSNLPLYGGLAVALCGLGALILAAVRGRKD